MENAIARRRTKCRFYNSEQGCRNGDACPFAHTRDREGSAPVIADEQKARPRRTWKRKAAKTDTALEGETSASREQPAALKAQPANLKAQTAAPEAQTAAPEAQPVVPRSQPGAQGARVIVPPVAPKRQPVASKRHPVSPKVPPARKEASPVTRAPVCPALRFDWIQEQKSLEKLFGWQIQENASSKRSDHYIIAMSPSDPDFPSVTFPNGLHLCIEVPQEYKVKGQQAALLPTLEVTDDGVPVFYARELPRRFSTWIRTVKFDRPIYHSLIALDTSLAELQRIEEEHRRIEALRTAAEQSRLAAPVDLPPPWSEEEEQRLKDALVMFGGNTNVPQKWADISDHVKSKTARQCWDQFKQIRSTGRSNVSAETERNVEEPLGSGARDVADDSGIIIGDLTGGQSLVLRELVIEGLGVVRSASVRFIIACTRCGKKEEFNQETSAPNTKAHVLHVTCVNCRSGIICSFISEFAHAQSKSVGRFLVLGASVVDILPSDFLGTCLSCDSQAKFYGVFSGIKRSSVCRHCHQKLSLTFGAAQLEGRQEQTSTRLVPLPAKPKREKDTTVLVVGTPLPKNGTCGHYKKSLRWFRFPCCGKAYPCDTCHDEQSDHPSEFAHRMICGLCSREQSTQNKSCVCGSDITVSRSSHWEGGKGCRDPRQMSRKDGKKYKLLSKESKARSEKSMSANKKPNANDKPAT